MFWGGLQKKGGAADMSSGDLIQMASRAAGQMAIMLKEGKRISDRGYQENLLVEILLHLATQLEALEVTHRHGPENVFVFLPENVPVIPFQLVPLIASYRLKVVFKAPSSERTFYKILGEKTGLKFLWISHKEALDMAKDSDFVIGFGGQGLGKALSALDVPHRFFGPKFSLAIVEEKDLYSVMLDALSFDGEACLSPLFVFMEEPNFESAWKLLEKAATERLPQLSFNREVFEYATSFLSYYSDSFRIGENFALIQIGQFPHFIPQRTVFLVKGGEKEALKFLGEKADLVQAIITHKRPLELLEKTAASLVLPPGRAQFPPLTWAFQKGVTLANFFSV